MKIVAEVSLHDKYQIEFKFACPFEHAKKVNDCHFDIFFFLPRNLSINSQTYGRKEFYDDFSEYIRFKTPSYSLERLAAKDNPVFARLTEAVALLPEQREEFDKRLKMFCSIAKSALRDGGLAIAQCPLAERDEAVKNYLKNAKALLHSFRKLGSRISGVPKAKELYDLVDEFLSITVNGYSYRLWNLLAAQPDGGVKKLCEAIAEETHREIVYRERRKYPSVPRENGENSELLYRESTLKKAMAGILFLDVATRKDGIFLENLLLGLSAAVAMIFVTAIAFLWKGLFLEEFSLSFFIVWVIAYMFKDRIKSQLQLLCLNNRSRYSYDYRQTIRDGLGNGIGNCREGFRYCDGKDLSDAVSLVRGRTMLSRLENGSLAENVMVYRKKLELRGDGCKDIFREFDVHGIVDICRLNVRRWTAKMDNPGRTIYCSNGRKIIPIKAHRDYHVNIVLRYGEKDGEEQYARYRLVLCRSGIRRLEPFLS